MMCVCLSQHWARVRTATTACARPALGHIVDDDDQIKYK